MRKFIIGCTMLAAAIQANGQGQVRQLSIQQCIDYAREHNQNIKISRYDEQISEKQKNEVIGRAMPQANINGTFENRLRLPQLVIPAPAGGFALPGIPATGGAEGVAIPMGFKYNTVLSGEVTQMIVDPSFGVALKGAMVNKELNEQRTEQTVEQTSYNVANAYYTVIVSQKQLDLLRTNLQNTRYSLANTELLFENGLAKKVDVSRLAVNVSNLESQVRQSELHVQRAGNILKFQMGMHLEEQIVLTDTALTFNIDENVLPEGMEQYYDQRLDNRIIETNIEMQDIERRNTARGYFPTLRAFANYAYQAQGPELGMFRTQNNQWIDFTTSSIGLRLNVPVFDGLQRNARIQQAKIREEQLRVRQELVKQNIDLEVSNAYTQYRNTLQRINAEQNNVQLAEEVYNITQLEFREGLSTSTDLVGAETSLRQAQNTYAQTLLDLFNARLDLERAKGTLLQYLNAQ